MHSSMQMAFPTACIKLQLCIADRHLCYAYRSTTILCAIPTKLKSAKVHAVLPAPHVCMCTVTKATGAHFRFDMIYLQAKDNLLV